ncbi:TPA: minichromosome maintenance protein MCM [Candidatus Micrarchaeota archaeon]|nr:minichromosome maintenance protein MCM [Candidatus Micrarchaeota archaeon]
MEKADPTPVIAVFSDFFNSIYKKQINEVARAYPNKRSLVIDYLEFEKFDHEHADRLVKEPDLYIEAAEEAIKQLRTAVSAGGEFIPHVRFLNFPFADNALIEQLGSKSINEVVSFKGVVTKRADIMHRVKIAVYKCQLCDSELRVLVTKNFVPPKRCDDCKKFALKQVEDESKFVDIQRAEVQELLERVRGGTPAAKIELWMEDDLVNLVIPGENIEISGILRLKPPLKTRNKQEMIFSRYIEVIHVKSMKRDFEEIEITEEDERRILEISKDPNIDKIIISSVAPAIYGHDEVKKALTLQLFGGTKGKTLKGGAPIRDDIHLLLIGDPGIAKSRLVQGVVDIAPKSIYVSGKSVSGAGLTVSAEKDELGEGGWTLKAGALVLASGGLAGVDEFDKIEEEDRSSMHEVMESQKISVAKAGIVATFRAKCAICAAANPKYGRFDQNRNLADQFDVPPTLLSRFDLIFPIIDVLDPEKDAKLATHILSAHMGKDLQENEPSVPVDFLRKYIAYARRNVHPLLTQPAMEKIKEFYVDLRNMGRDVGSVAITPRYLEGLVRLSEANAKIRLSQLVEEKDADAAIDLMRYVMRQIMTDKVTGAFDVDVVATGKPKSERDKLQKSETILNIIREHLKNEDSADVEKVISDAASYDIDAQTARRIITELLRKGDLYEKEHGHVKMVSDRKEY